MVSNATFGDNNQGNQFGMIKSKGPMNFGSGGAGVSYSHSIRAPILTKQSCQNAGLSHGK